MAPMWKRSVKNVDVGEPTSFLDHVYLGCTQRECKANEIIFEQKTQMFESRFSPGVTEKLPGWEKHHAKTVAWSYDMEGHTKKCVARCCELANRKTGRNYQKSQVLAWMIIISRKRNFESVGEFFKSMLTNCH